MNSEVEDPRTFSKDRWPIPLFDTKFLNVSANMGQIVFGSTYPTLLIMTDSVSFEMGKFNSEVLHLNDPEFIEALTEILIRRRNLSD